MNVDEFEALMDRCKIMLNDSGEVSLPLPCHLKKQAEKSLLYLIRTKTECALAKS